MPLSGESEPIGHVPSPRGCMTLEAQRSRNLAARYREANRTPFADLCGRNAVFPGWIAGIWKGSSIHGNIGRKRTGRVLDRGKAAYYNRFYKRSCLRGGVRFPTGGNAARLPTSPRAAPFSARLTPVGFRGRRYSPDGRSGAFFVEKRLCAPRKFSAGFLLSGLRQDGSFQCKEW